jgi:hypothetical protein
MNLDQDSSRLPSRGLGLLHRRNRLVPTWRGWLALALLVSVVVAWLGATLSVFLSPSEDVTGDIWVVQGWMSDAALRKVAAEPSIQRARAIFVVGGPRDKGSLLIGMRSHARVGAVTLVGLGLDSSRVHVVEAPATSRDRTFTSTLALSACLEREGHRAGELMLASPGPHARRSRMLLLRALQGNWTVRVGAIPETTYESGAWWKSNEGFRVVAGGALGYMHALAQIERPFIDLKAVSCLSLGPSTQPASAK